MWSHAHYNGMVDIYMKYIKGKQGQYWYIRRHMSLSLKVRYQFHKELGEHVAFIIIIIPQTFIRDVGRQAPS